MKGAKASVEKALGGATSAKDETIARANSIDVKLGVLFDKKESRTQVLLVEKVA